METLRRIRTMRGMNQVDLSRASGVSQNTISEIETGRREARPATLLKLAGALGVEIADFFEEADRPKWEAPPGLQQSFNGLLEEERRFTYLRAWRAFVWSLEKRWKEEPPKTSREIAVVLDSMQALVDEGAFGSPPGQITTSDWREASEGIELQALFLGLRRLNAIADTVEEDRTAQQRRELLKVLPGGLSA